jgi:hypothetical protein
MIALAVIAASVALPALAQNNAGQNDSGLPAGPKPAIRTDNTPPPAMPVPGKSSFTADQAREHMLKRGYNITSNPLKDDNGIWYAEGQRNGRTVMVMMDYQGNVYEGHEYNGHPSSAPGLEPTLNNGATPVSPKQQ